MKVIEILLMYFDVKMLNATTEKCKTSAIGANELLVSASVNYASATP